MVYLRRALLLALDDLLAVTGEFLCPQVSRPGLDRCLRRHGVGNLRALHPAPDKPAAKAFKACVPGYVHVDVKYLPQLADEGRRRYLFVAIDRATRWVYVALKPDKRARSARAFLNALARACPVRITRLLTTMAPSSRTGCSVAGRGHRPGRMNSIGCARNWVSSTA